MAATLVTGFTPGRRDSVGEALMPPAGLPQGWAGPCSEASLWVSPSIPPPSSWFCQLFLSTLIHAPWSSQGPCLKAQAGHLTESWASRSEGSPVDMAAPALASSSLGASMAGPSFLSRCSV